MATAVTPSDESKTTTDGQIDKATANYRALLVKHAREFDSEALQTVLGQPELAQEQFEVLRRRVEVISEMIVRRVRVNRSRTRSEAIAATKRAECTDSVVVAEMPQCEGEEADVYFFPLKKYTGVGDVQKALDEHGLKPDPYAVVAVNEADPAFADKWPNGTQWLDKGGKYCYVAFGRWIGGRGVLCDRFGSGWNGYWWVGGVRK